MTSSQVAAWIAMLASLVELSAIGNPEPLFISELEAVTAATNIYNPISIRNDKEYMGMIYRSGDYYGFTVTAGKSGTGYSSIQITRKELATGVAFWHTHGKPARAHRYFSPTDTALVNRYQLPFYLADYTGYLKIFRPGDHTLSSMISGRLGLRMEAGFATGDVVRDDLYRPVKIAVTDKRNVEMR